MVCLGNICRSPLAEGIMIEKLKKYNIYFQVDSAGTGGWHVGSAPDKRSIKVGTENGIDISTLKPGVYFVQITDEKTLKTTTQKFIKQ